MGTGNISHEDIVLSYLRKLEDDYIISCENIGEFLSSFLKIDAEDFAKRHHGEFRSLIYFMLFGFYDTEEFRNVRMDNFWYARYFVSNSRNNSFKKQIPVKFQHLLYSRLSSLFDICIRRNPVEVFCSFQNYHYFSRNIAVYLSWLVRFGDESLKNEIFDIIRESKKYKVLSSAVMRHRDKLVIDIFARMMIEEQE